MNNKCDEETFRVCPKCGDNSIYNVLGMITGQLYKCPNCGYEGALVIEGNKKLVREIRKKYEKEETSKEE